MASGITAKLLHVDLTTRQTRTEEIPETYYEMAGRDGETGKPMASKLAELGLTEVKA